MVSQLRDRKIRSLYLMNRSAEKVEELAKQYDGNPNVLAVLEGPHQIEVRQGSSIIYREKVFVSSGETHAVTILPGTSQ